MNKKKLHITLIDRFNNTVFDDFIAKFDASRFNTAIYTQEGIISESSIIRLTENLRSIQIIDGTVIIIYESDARCLLTRQ
jgi:CRISPR/Cas system-associated endoribonuclease Cas2